MRAVSSAIRAGVTINVGVCLKRHADLISCPEIRLVDPKVGAVAFCRTIFLSLRADSKGTPPAFTTFTNREEFLIGGNPGR